MGGVKMDIFQLNYFVSAASIGNFTMAAAENNISQSSFSKQIMNLEDELGIELFSRKKKSIILTPAGKQFLEYAHKMLGIYNEMLNVVDSFSTFQTYPVNIFSIPVILPYSIEDVIFKINRENPDLVISINELAESSYVSQALRRGECDFAILRTDFLDEHLYNIYPIIIDRLVAVVPENHVLANNEIISLIGLKNEHFIMPPKDTDLRTIAESACIRAGFRPNVRYIVSGNVDLTLKIVSKQNMIYLAFENVIDYYDLEGCKLVPLKENIVSSTAFVSEKKAGQTRALKKISKFLEKEYGKRFDIV
jgi:DNA-binding transcriptional LysR family regulator